MALQLSGGKVAATFEQLDGFQEAPNRTDLEQEDWPSPTDSSAGLGFGVQLGTICTCDARDLEHRIQREECIVDISTAEHHVLRVARCHFVGTDAKQHIASG